MKKKDSLTPKQLSVIGFFVWLYSLLFIYFVLRVKYGSFAVHDFFSNTDNQFVLFSILLYATVFMPFIHKVFSSEKRVAVELDCYELSDVFMSLATMVNYGKKDLVPLYEKIGDLFEKKCVEKNNI